MGLLLQAIKSHESLICIAGSKSDLFRVGISWILPELPVVTDSLNNFYRQIFFWCSQAVERVQFSDLKIPSQLFAVNVILLASLCRELKLSLE